MINRTNLNNSLRVILDNWDDKIDGLEKDIHRVKEESKEEYYKEINKLKNQKNVLQEQVDSIQEASEKGLEEIEEGLQSAKDAFKETLDKAKDLFKENE
ncbi:MAG TPA: hypothetical protein VJ962_12760 [Clostridia bacterium]|nr:hypothetical protein [Clostridia bacterium]